MIERKKTDKLVVHCADTPEDMDIGAEKIREWHTKERGWDDIGYHWVIKRDGTLEAGRAINKQGAHAKAVNGSSIGCCLVGRGDNFTDDQYYTLHNLIVTTQNMYPDIEVIGHSDVEPKKPNCPGFDVKEWYKEEFIGPSDDDLY
tara:strand:- start:48 stop:482 length:435 start_codon:yes stop_codon:yes gene_type:complete